MLVLRSHSTGARARSIDPQLPGILGDARAFPALKTERPARRSAGSAAGRYGVYEQRSLGRESTTTSGESERSIHLRENRQAVAGGRCQRTRAVRFDAGDRGQLDKKFDEQT